MTSSPLPTQQVNYLATSFNADIPDFDPTEPIDTEAPVEVDNDNFSDYGGSLASETQSLTSSIHEYVFKNGRRYHSYYGPDKNPMPTDELEMERLDIMHELILLATGSKLYQAPLRPDRLHNVLDLGTGSGVWAVDFAQMHSQASVLGVDLSPTQPTWVPPNCRFETDDIELDWTFRTPFDFIHARTLCQSILDWPRLIKQAYDHLNPGGALEIAEGVFGPTSDDDSLPPGYPPVVAFKLFREGLEKSGRMSPTADDVKRMMERAGFVDIRVKKARLPIGKWPKKPALKMAGGLMLQCIENGGYESYGMALMTDVLGMPVEEAQAICDAAKKVHFVKNSTAHPYMPYFSVYGRKKSTGEDW